MSFSERKAILTQTTFGAFHRLGREFKTLKKIIYGKAITILGHHR